MAYSPYNEALDMIDNSSGGRVGYRITYQDAGVEISQLIPNNTKQLYVAVDDKNARLKLSFQQTGTLDNGLNDYITVEYGNSYFRTGLDLNDKTLYLNSNKGSLTIEIEAWV